MSAQAALELAGAAPRAPPRSPWPKAAFDAPIADCYCSLCALRRIARERKQQKEQHRAQDS